jgi:adenylate kinase
MCDECGSMDFVYREDDSEESVKNRLSIYNQKTHPLIEYYRQQKILFEIDAMRKVNEISSEILSKILKT